MTAEPGNSASLRVARCACVPVGPATISDEAPKSMATRVAGPSTTMHVWNRPPLPKESPEPTKRTVTATASDRSATDLERRRFLRHHAPDGHVADPIPQRIDFGEHRR